MGIPKKGLRESNLKDLTAGKALNDGSHQIIRVAFIENKVQKQGFFKKLDPENHYPELLAKISVSVSVFMRLFQGEYCAEERLVFDDNGKIVGTVSLSLNNFRSFNFAEEKIPAHAADRDQVIPTTELLVKANAMETMLGPWVGNNDDFHPHNWGFSGTLTAHLDFDMFFYWFVIHMKEPRPIIGVPSKSVNLTVTDWNNFPALTDAKHYHDPTYNHPGQNSLPEVSASAQSIVLPKVLPKAYPKPKEFHQLAGNPDAQKQKLAGALKLLLTYDLSMVKARLEEVFGDLTLNYTALNPRLRQIYEKEFPLLCNAQTDNRPFVDFMMDLYQMHYDNFYRVVVYHMGCQANIYGLTLPPTHEALFKMPSYFRKIVIWAEEQNKGLLAGEAEEVTYNRDKLQKRYHQIWRDAFAPKIRHCLEASYSLTKELYVAASTNKDIPSYSCKEATDESITESWQFFGDMPVLDKNAIMANTTVAEGHPLRKALPAMIDFTRQLYAITRKYYQINYNDLKERDNLSFIQSLEHLLSDFDMPVREALSASQGSHAVSQVLNFTSSHARKFNTIHSELKMFANMAHFQRHLMQTDEQIQESSALVLKQELKFTHPQVIEKFNHALFAWAKTQTKDQFDLVIGEILSEHYASSIQLNRQRADYVTAYLKASGKEKSDVRLAYILSSGTEDGALNRAIIKHIGPTIPEVQHVSSIREAIVAKTFNNELSLYAVATARFAKDKFIHLYATQGTKQFFKNLFQWVDSKTSAEFLGIAKSALTEYEGKKSSLGWLVASLSGQEPSRRDEVEATCKLHKESTVKSLAIIFMNGKKESSYNKYLFNKIIELIKADIKKKPAMLEDPGFALIAAYNSFLPNEHEAFYLALLREQSVPFSNIEGKAHKREEDKRLFSSI